MKKLLQIEWLKQSSFAGFNVLLIIHFFLFALTILGVSAASTNGVSLGGALFKFPNAWSVVPWIASWFNLFLGLIAIIITGNEFSYKTFRQQVLCGQSRSNIISGKVIMLGVLSIYAFILTFITTSVVGLIYTTDYDLVSFWDGSEIMLVYFVQTFAYMAMGMMISTLIRNNALSIVLYLCYALFVEWIFRLIINAFTTSSITEFFPIKIISNLTPLPDFLNMLTSTAGMTIEGGGAPNVGLSQEAFVSPPMDISVTVPIAIAYIAIFLSITYYSANKKNL
jgi:ABC-type transport system involved in multi-copper enzyme maturation permease subunit